MIAILFVALFATVAVASALTLADAVVRGRIAIRQVRGALVQCEAIRVITVTMEGVECPRIPALRPVSLSGGRSSQRRTVAATVPRRAAA